VIGESEDMARMPSAASLEEDAPEVEGEG